MILFYPVRQTRKVRAVKPTKKTEPAVTKTFRIPLDLYSIIEAEIGPHGDFSEYARQALREKTAADSAARATRGANPQGNRQQ